jgi:hypothetical protein
MVGVPAMSMMSLIVKGTPWKGGRPAPAATALGRLGRLESPLAQHDDGGVDRGIHGLDPPEVGLHDLGASLWAGPALGQPVAVPCEAGSPEDLIAALTELKAAL